VAFRAGLYFGDCTLQMKSGRPGDAFYFLGESLRVLKVPYITMLLFKVASSCPHRFPHPWFLLPSCPRGVGLPFSSWVFFGPDFLLTGWRFCSFSLCFRERGFGSLLYTCMDVFSLPFASIVSARCGGLGRLTLLLPPPLIPLVGAFRVSSGFARYSEAPRSFGPPSPLFLRPARLLCRT